MRADDQELHGLLRAELATATPPAEGGGLGEVVRRGRRRRRVRQAGAALAVVAVLGVTTATAVALSGADQPRVADSPVAAELDWPRVDLPNREPIGTVPVGPPGGDGFKAINVCRAAEGGYLELGFTPVSQELLNTVETAVRTVAPGLVVGDLTEQPTQPSVEYRSALGDGSLRLLAGQFAGDPVAAADDQAFDLANCTPPKRRVLANGTVLQLYPPQVGDEDQMLTQALRVLRPDGTMYEVAIADWAARPALQLTERQLADVGLLIS